MEIFSKKDFISSWEKEIDSYKKGNDFFITYPFGLEEPSYTINKRNELSQFQNNNMTEEKLYSDLYYEQRLVQRENENVRDFQSRVIKEDPEIFKVAPNYRVHIVRDEGTDQYSYENGYFFAFKILVNFAVSSDPKYDESVLYLPLFFLARHYIELSLKDAIFNLSIATGKPLKIGKSPNHNLCQLSEEFEALLTENKFYSEKSKDSQNLILNKTFFNIPKAINKLTQKSDEFRYPVNAQGEINISRNKPALYNLLGLTKDMNYFFACMDSLRLVLDGVFQDTIYENDAIIGVLSKLWSQKQKLLIDKSTKSGLKQGYQSIILNLFKNAYLKNIDEKSGEVNKIVKNSVSFKESDTEIKVFCENDYVFSIYSSSKCSCLNCSCSNEKNYYIKTDKLIKEIEDSLNSK
ncbi:hypothetical protein [Lactobacillus sp. ESL0261]|uniref:hypothetical protein n=1 Tax=Lactobacillus sp. ESL0261 TaxID=2069348 RepID=UPI000EFB1C16|nr:hypothetical protein [Lactobacillus sp. ESL0261]RMC52896.1 hypothetical protein F5ESL0261_09055 [Lactobacillus sp. ESL0261]